MICFCIASLLLSEVYSLHITHTDINSPNTLPSAKGKIYPVIIIGAGMAGIAASTVLNLSEVEHLILEGRDRIGGRIQ